MTDHDDLMANHDDFIYPALVHECDGPNPYCREVGLTEGVMDLFFDCKRERVTGCTEYMAGYRLAFGVRDG